MSETTELQNPQPQERKGGKRKEIDEKISGTLDWLSTLDEKVAKGLLSSDAKNNGRNKTVVVK